MPEFTPEVLSALVTHIREAVRAERDAVKKTLGLLGDSSGVRVTDGIRLHVEPGAYQYRFESTSGDDLPDGIAGIAEGTRVTLEVPGTLASGEVLDHDVDSQTIDLALRDDLGRRVERGLLNFDSTFLLDRLMLRLDELEMGGVGGEKWNMRLAASFMSGAGEARPAVAIARTGLTADQCKAVGFVLGQPVSYLWGPPGTGKTRTVAHLVHELAERGESVLLAAHTNVATDTALLRVLQTRERESGWALRVGHHGESLRKYEVGLDELADDAIRRQAPDVAGEIVQLCREVARATGREVSERAPLGRRLRIAGDLLRLDEADAELTERAATLAESMRQLEVQTIRRAAVVATTLTRLYTDRRLETLRMDALVLDEASIASRALAFVAACFARRRAVAVGDFMQLPAIAQTEQPAARAWLGEHVFNGAGCDRAESDHPLRAMLRVQWRMHPQISAVVGRVFYAGKLTDAAPLRERAHSGPAVLLLDSSRSGAGTRTTATGSKRNETHARIVAELVRRASGKGIAVITPYRAQVRELRAAVRAIDPAGLASGRIEVFTVHRFQGRDKEMVIFDTVEAPGTRPNFLSELQNADAPNLVNVALSRAMEKLVIVCHMRHLNETLGRASMLCRVLAQARQLGAWELVSGYPSDEPEIEQFLSGAV